MKSIRELREESKGETRILYHLNYWDGPISGVCLYNGQRCYFNTIDEVTEEYLMSDKDWEDWCMWQLSIGKEIDPDDRTEINWYRIFAIYETPKEDIEILDENNNMFCKYVGTHNNYDNSGCRGSGARVPVREDHPEDLGDLKPYSEHDKFYKAKRREPKLDVENWKILEKFIF